MESERKPIDTSAPDGFSSAIQGILSNPEMMSMISSIAKDLKNSSEKGDKEERRESFESTTSPAEAISEPTAISTPPTDIGTFIGKLAPLLSSSGNIPRSKKENDRDCLLRALKPYLSDSRSEAIEYIIKFSVLAKVLKNLS